MLHVKVVAAVEGAVADGFHDVVLAHAGRAFEVGDGARDREMTQQQWEDFCFNRGYLLDDTDDCYTVVDGPGYIHHQHIPSWCVFKPHFPIPKHIEEKLHRDYQATIEEIGPTSEPS